ncbi:MAG: anti-sigma factor antagonist [Chloroflexota bacterium]|nr:anti-sigma factor antagonist [Chloroflexota bacterium]
MAFEATLVTRDGVAKITLAGELDASTASVLRAEVEQAAASQPRRLVLLMQDLTYMASAGLRALIYAKQKMGPDVALYVVGAQEQVTDTLVKTGFHHSIIALDRYDDVEVEIA